jgi:hypothetical protein
MEAGSDVCAIELPPTYTEATSNRLFDKSSNVEWLELNYGVSSANGARARNTNLLSSILKSRRRLIQFRTLDALTYHKARIRGLSAFLGLWYYLNSASTPQYSICLRCDPTDRIKRLQHNIRSTGLLSSSPQVCGSLGPILRLCSISLHFCT